MLIGTVQPEVGSMDEAMGELKLEPLRSLGMHDLNDLLAALIEAQKEFKPIKRSQTATVRTDKGTYTYEYASLADIHDAVDDALANHGLKIIYRPYLVSDLYLLRAYLIHTSGQYIDCDYPLDPDTSGRKAQHQERGSAITYGCKYTMSCLLGLAPEDDDARRADARTGRRQQPPRSQPPKQQPPEPGQESPETGQGNGKRVDFRQIAGDYIRDLQISRQSLRSITYARYGAGAGVEEGDWSHRLMTNEWWEDLALWLKRISSPASPEDWVSRINLYPLPVRAKICGTLAVEDMLELESQWDITWDMAKIVDSVKSSCLPTDLQVDCIEAYVDASDWETVDDPKYLGWLGKKFGIAYIENFLEAEKVLTVLSRSAQKKGTKVELPDLDEYDESGTRKMEDSPEAEDDMPF